MIEGVDDVKKCSTCNSEYDENTVCSKCYEEMNDVMVHDRNDIVIELLELRRDHIDN